MNEKIQNMLEVAGITDYQIFGRIESKEDCIENLVYLVVSDCCRQMVDLGKIDPAKPTISEIKKSFGFYS